MRWQGRGKPLHHNDNHDDNHDHDNHDDPAAGVLDAEQHQPRRAQLVHADTRPTSPNGVHAQAPSKRVGPGSDRGAGTNSHVATGP